MFYFSNQYVSIYLIIICKNNLIEINIKMEKTLFYLFRFKF